MFSPDVISLKEFYSSPIGRVVQRQISSSISRTWNNILDDDLIALGYCLPYLDSLSKTAKTTIPLMTGTIGGIYWPPSEDNKTVLVDEFNLPLAESSVNRAIIIHACEHTRHVRRMLRSLWHTLTSGGRAIIIVPNRRSLWSQAGNTPFGSGQPFNINQLRRRIEEESFTYVTHETALHMPPLNWRILHKTSSICEILGKMFLPAFGGVIVMEVEKQIYASIPEPTRMPVRELLYPSKKGVTALNKE